MARFQAIYVIYYYTVDIFSLCVQAILPPPSLQRNSTPESRTHCRGCFLGNLFPPSAKNNDSVQELLSKNLIEAYTLESVK